MCDFEQSNRLRGWPRRVLFPLGEQIERGLVTHRDETLRWLAHNKRIKLLTVDYPKLIDSPAEIIASITEFLGPELLPHPERMGSAIDPALYRRRIADA